MPATIPHDPSLILGNIVEQEKLDNLIKISELKAPVDTSLANLNSLIALKRSIDITVQEMLNMGVDAKELIIESEEIKKQVQKATVDYGQVKIKAENAIQPLRSLISAKTDIIESPIDYNKSLIKKMPLSTDSMQANIQYFSFEEDSGSSSLQALSLFVNDSLSHFGDIHSAQIAASAQTEVNSQVSKQHVAGTLVICITSTHKNALVFNPFKLDVDKAVEAWNTLIPDNIIQTNDPASIGKIEARLETKDDKILNLIYGATCGSSVVGMVHVLDTSKMSSSQSMESIAASLQASVDNGGWFAEAQGGFGVASSFSNSAKNLLSTQNVQSHCSLVTLGIMPSTKSNQINKGVQKLAEGPRDQMEALAALQGASATEINSVAASTEETKTGRQIVNLKSESIQSAISEVSEIDKLSNKIIDTNSMMTAMDDYIQMCIEGGSNLGVPINYYLKPITQSMIAKAWLQKYYPNKFK